MRMFVLAAIAAFGLFGCQEKKSSTNQGGLVQAPAPVSPAAPTSGENDQTKMTATGNPDFKVSQPVVAESQSIQNGQKAATPDPTAGLVKTKDNAGKDIYFRKQEAPTSAPAVAEMQTKLVKVPISSLAPPSASRTAFFTGQNFYFNMAARGSEPQLFEQHYKDKWLVFKSNQDFEIYQKSILVGKGRWTFKDSDNQLFLSCDDAYLNNSWKFQSMPAAVLLVGNTELNKTGIQARLFMTDEKPH